MNLISQHYQKHMFKHGIGHHPDLMVVLDKAVFTLACKSPSIEGWNTATLEGFGGPAGEGTHVAISYIETKQESLDHFLRLLLVNLNLFRGIMDHPGFDWASSRSGKANLRYITSFTNEKDSKKRQELLSQYQEQAMKELGIAK